MQRRECIPRRASLSANQGERRVCFRMIQPNRITAVQKLAFNTVRILENLKLQGCRLLQASINFSLVNTRIVLFPYCIAR